LSPLVLDYTSMSEVTGKMSTLYLAWTTDLTTLRTRCFTIIWVGRQGSGKLAYEKRTSTKPLFRLRME
jgi:hypothetical protein